METQKIAPNCTVCGQAMTWKTGVSKTTNKPYAFWGCNTRNTDGSFCKGKPTSLPTVDITPNAQNRPITKVNGESIQTPTSTQIDQIVAELRAISEALDQLVRVVLDKRI